MKRKAIATASLLLFGAATTAITLLPGETSPLPPYALVRDAYRSSEALLLDRHGGVIHELRVDDTGRRLAWTPLADISAATLRTIVDAEDHRFYEHHGVDWKAVIGAVRDNLTGASRRGASTLSMQLASLLDPALQSRSGQRSPSQKWAQMRRARRIEASWSKDQILEAYLNLVTFRGELQGIGAASRGLFDKTPDGIDETESLILAALLRSPNSEPVQIARRACALGQRLRSGAACGGMEARVGAATGTVPRIRPAIALAPHVARQLFATAYGSGARKPPGTPRLVSALDAGVQRFATNALGHQLELLAGGNVDDGAALVVDNATGEVLAYVGNAAGHDDTRYVDGVQAPRQAGSTLKPFLYALAIERRLLTAASLLEDAPVNLVTPTGLYVPQNYDKDFHGLVSVRTSLAGSLNVPAVKTLMLTGVDDFVERLRRLGFSGLTEPGDYYGYSLALGSAEVTLWQLVNAYRTLANGGVSAPLRLLPGVNAAPGVRVVSAAAAFVAADILADRSARSVTFGLDNPLATSFWSAVKTGTSKDMRDNWCVGFTPRFTVGVWVGNFSGEAMHDVSGVTGAAPVWLEIMNYLHQDGAVERPQPPAGVVAEAVRYAPSVEAPRNEWFLAGTETGEVALNVAPARTARIAYPGNDMLIALDPDIPADRQRVFFEAEPRGGPLLWRLDGERLAAGDEGWSPRHGSHVLQLSDSTGRVVDEVRFQVRGGN